MAIDSTVGPLDDEVVLGRLASMRGDLDEGLVPVGIFNDPDVYRLELERIFGRSWIFVAHESEIPSHGDYVARSVGEDSFIIARDENGTIRALFDACRHRGAQVCSRSSARRRCG